MQKIINVISGKGGTGKTLLTAVLAEMLGNRGRDVLVVDMDIFVRGLTALLYFQKGESLKIIDDGEWSVSDFFKNNNKDVVPAIVPQRYRSFDVFPSVALVNEIVKFNITPTSPIEAKQILVSILKSIPNKYDYVFLDSRAGYDELIRATHRQSDFSLCVEEDDNISMITSENLISQLEDGSNIPILRIKNKTHQVQTTTSAMGLSFVGTIPFDADVMNSFGTKNFWTEIDKSLYKESLIKVWNTLAKKMKLGFEFPESDRISPVGMQKAEKHLAILPSLKRVAFVYGILLLIFGFFLSFNVVESSFIQNIMSNPLRLGGLLGSVIGLALVLYAVLTGNGGNSKRN